MTIIQRKESMNSLMKEYIDITISLIAFLKAFKSALEQRKNNVEFKKFYKNNKIISLCTISSYKK